MQIYTKIKEYLQKNSMCMIEVKKKNKSYTIFIPKLRIACLSWKVKGVNPVQYFLLRGIFLILHAICLILLAISNILFLEDARPRFPPPTVRNFEVAYVVLNLGIATETFQYRPNFLPFLYLDRE